jgi:hypothetical protein
MILKNTTDQHTIYLACKDPNTSYIFVNITKNPTNTRKHIYQKV